LNSSARPLLAQREDPSPELQPRETQTVSHEFSLRQAPLA